MQPYEELEVRWAEWNGLDPKGMVACSSGTAALHLALEALQFPPQSEVLTSDFNMIAVPRAISMAGLTPVLVDCDERLLMDRKIIVRELLNPRVKVVLVVHIYGRKIQLDDPGFDDPPDEKVYLIEDLAEAHGVRPNPTTDVACWSFYKNKIISGEEGGAVWFRDPAHARPARQLRSLGFTDAHDFMHVPRGHNYRMSNLHAKPILDSIAKYGIRQYGRKMGVHDDKSAGRLQIQEWYDAACPDEWRMPARDAVWVYDLRLRGLADEIPSPGEAAWDRKDLMGVVRALNAEGIEARASFAPMHWQEEYKGYRLVAGREGPMTQAERAAMEVLYLPVAPGHTTEADCYRAYDVLRRITDGRTGAV